MQLSNSYRDTSFRKSEAQIQYFIFALKLELQKIKLFECTASVNELFEEFQSKYDYILDKYAPLRITKNKNKTLIAPGCAMV